MTHETTNLGDSVDAVTRHSFRHRMLAESTRYLERHRTTPLADQDAVAEAVRRGGDFESRLISRAQRLTPTTELDQAVDQTRTVLMLVVGALLLLAALAGAGAARAVLGQADRDAINVYWVLLNLLGLQTVLGLVWIIAMLVRPRSAPVISLGGIVLSVAERLGRAMLPGDAPRAVIQALAFAWHRGGIARWGVSMLSHLCWLAFNVGCVTLLIILLSTRSYSFGWETTILDETTYEPLTEALALAPETLGFPVPDSEQIAASRLDLDPPPPESTREPWSWFVIGCVTLYGLAPRVIAAALCGAFLMRARRRYRLSVDAPGFARLRPALMPASRRIGVVIPEHEGDSTTPERKTGTSATERRDDPILGPPCLAGYEIATPASGWPPALHGVHWDDLGIIETRTQRREALEHARSAEHPPAAFVLVCELQTTPDRGAASVLRSFRDTGAPTFVLVLTGGQRMRERDGAESLAERVNDWRRIAADIELDDHAILEVDLDHLTDRTRRQLKSAMGVETPSGNQDAQPRQRHLEEVCRVIVEHARQWPAEAAPTLEAQSDLHRAITTLHGDDGSALRRLLKLEGATSIDDVLNTVRERATSVIDHLPASLRISPQWIAAGAVAGALGCVTAAALISPVAIGSLPIWSGLGAAITAVYSAGRGDAESDGEQPLAEGDAFDRAVRAATLLGILLEAQHLDESAISRVLDATLGPTISASESLLNSADDAHQWLGEVRHRFDDAMAREVQVGS